jgi:hypothetical protein
MKSFRQVLGIDISGYHSEVALSVGRSARDEGSVRGCTHLGCLTRALVVVVDGGDGVRWRSLVPVTWQQRLVFAGAG